MSDTVNTAAGGAAWMVAARLAERALGLISTMVLARLLMPADFGLVAMAMVFVAAADLLGAFGLDWALVRQPHVEARHLDTAWTIRAALGIASLLALMVLAVPAAHYYREPRITAMVIFLGVSLLIGTLENPGVVMFRRDMNFVKEFQLRTTAKVIGAVLAVSGALLFRSYWALLIGTLASRGSATVMSYVVHPHRPRPTLSARSELLAFSIWLWVGNVLTFLRVRIVQLILGRIVGARDLGLFAVSGELSDLASTELAAPINRALFSAYAKKGSDPAAVGEAYLEAAPVIFAATLPVIAGTLLAAAQVIYLLLGPQWSEAVPLLQILCLAGMASLLTTGALHVYWAVNQAQLETWLESIWVLLLVTFVLVLTPVYGVEGAALATLISGACVAPVNFYFLRKYAGVTLRRSLARSWRTVVACTVMYGVVSTTLGHLVPGSTREAAQQLLLMGGLGALVYVAVLFGLWVATARPEGPETTLVRVIGRAIRARSADRVSAERLQVSPMDMGERPLVSVVIPAYNSAAYLQPALASVASQTYSPLEIILVDDGSTDGTVDVARRCGADVRIFTQPNRGAGAARNLGLEQARGQYIAFLDSDDLWHPRKIEFQMAHLLGCGGCVGVYCDKLELRGRSAEPDWAQARYLYDTVYMARDDATSGWLYLELLRDSIVHTSTLLVSREVLERTGRFDESLRKGQDLDYWLRLSRAGPIHRLAAVLSAYRIHPGSVSHRLMSTNFHAQVVERALRRFGVADPAGRTLARNEASSILALSWFEFAYHHFKHGSLSVCRESARRAIEYQPTMLRAWRLSLRARARSLLKSGAAQTTVRG